MGGQQLDRRHFLGLAAAGAGGAVITVGGWNQAQGAETVKRGAIAGLPPGVDWQRDDAMSDDFNGTTLDTTKWNPHHAWGDFHANQVAFTPKNATVSDGHLRLLLDRRTDPEHGNRHLSGVVTSLFTIGGDTYTEVRAKMIKSEANANSAIWLHAPDTNVEIDLHEYLLPERAATVRSAVHLWDADPELHTHKFCDDCTNGGSLDEAFYTYGLERRNGKVTFYIDGKAYWTYKGEALATEPQPLVLYIRGINDNKKINRDALPAAMLVDYVHVYRAKRTPD